MQNNKADLLHEIAYYYSEKLAQHGETPRGVDWNGEESQKLRFEQLCKIVAIPNFFSQNDLGCGFGALLEVIANKNQAFSYLGIDVSEDMVQAAKQRHQNNAQARFIVSDKPDNIEDYGVASGIFNVRLGRSDAEWLDHFEAALDTLDRTSRFGFAFNCLTSYSDEDKKHDYLYYADPCMLFDLCKRRYSRQVALLL